MIRQTRTIKSNQMVVLMMKRDGQTLKGERGGEPVLSYRNYQMNKGVLCKGALYSCIVNSVGSYSVLNSRGPRKQRSHLVTPFHSKVMSSLPKTLG